MQLLTTQESRYRHILFEAKGVARRRVIPRHIERRARREQAIGVRVEHAAFLRWLLDRAGVNFENYRVVTLAKRIAACLRALRAADVFEARLKIEERPELLETAVNSVLIGVTEFFRDREVFESIAREVMPRLRDRAMIRCWSAGCSDGAEAYSLAILLAEAGLLNRSRIHASDCRASAIEHAREGLVSSHVAGAIPPTIRQKYFTETRNGLHVCKMIRDRIDWKVGDVFSGSDCGCWDLISCRNLVIYCDMQAVGELWSSMHDALVSGGILIVGRSESPRGVQKFSRIGPCIYQKMGGAR